MARVALNGIEIDYAVTGRGRPVILSHGYGATRRMWDGQHAALGDRYRLITWDMRGHGQTETPDDSAQYSTELTVSDMRALLQTRGVRAQYATERPVPDRGALWRTRGAGRAVMGGLSRGGYLPLAFSLAPPEMVEAVTIGAPGPGYRNADARPAWNQRAPQRAAD